MPQSLPELEKQAFDHTWKWFEYHATQRMTTIRFYLIVAGAIATSIAYLWTAKYYLFAMAISAFGCVVSICFLRLDKRVSHLVKLAEAALKVQQSQMAGLLQIPELEICAKADELTHSIGWRNFVLPYSYSENIRILVGSSTLGFGIACFICLLASAGALKI